MEWRDAWELTGRGGSTAADWEGERERESVDSEAAAEAFEPHMSGGRVAMSEKGR